MKPYSVMFVYLMIVLYFSFLFITHASSSSSASTLLRGRQARKNLHAEKLDLQPKQQNIEVVETEWQKADSKGAAPGQIKTDETGDGEGDGDELIYHVDYHGISTHPYPSPKHPRP